MDSSSQQEMEPQYLPLKFFQIGPIHPLNIDTVQSEPVQYQSAPNFLSTEAASDSSEELLMDSPLQQVIEPHAVHIDELSAATEEKLLELPPMSVEYVFYHDLPGRKAYSTKTQYFTKQVVSTGPFQDHIMHPQESAPNFLSTEAASTHIENVDSSELNLIHRVPSYSHREASTSNFLSTEAASSSSEELLKESSSQQLMEPQHYPLKVFPIDPIHPLEIDTVRSEPIVCNSAPNILSTKAPSVTSEKPLIDSPSQQVMEPHAVSIDILSANTEKKLRVLPQLSNGCSIYTVPDRMKYSNERHYTPRVVSIGPIHYQNEKLRANQHLKERYLAEFCQHTKVSLNECYKLILNQETTLRNYYADVIELEKENFAEMVLVDAAFLLMILVYTRFRSLVSSSDKLFKNPNMMHDIIYDMLLLENQLPFFILEDLFKLSKLQNIVEREFNLNFGEENVMTYLGHQFCIMLEMTKTPRGRPGPNALHILDMLKSYLTPADWHPERKLSQTRNIPSTKQLRQAGVKIKVGSEDNIFDIKFRHGILEVPPLVIEDTAELIFRNLLAFELCHCHEHIFSDYFEMMRLLTISAEDADLLIQSGAIDNALPSAQRVSTLFQSIDSGNIINWYQFLYSDVFERLNKYYGFFLHEWMATLKQKYFKAPWAICSVFVAALLLVLTITQTVLSILQVLPK